jgi:hypothetical protein
MADSRTDASPAHFAVRGQPLIGVAAKEGDTWTMRYYTSQAEADAAAGQDDVTWRRALEAAADLSDLEFNEMMDALHEIRHRNPPTPLLDPLS